MKESLIQDIVRNCYKKYLNREPDDEGFRHFVQLMKKKKINEEELINIIKTSEEYKLSHPIDAESNISIDVRMKEEWNARAKMNHMFVIATDSSQSEEEFWKSGEIDCDAILEKNGKRFQEIIQGNEPRKMKILEIGCGIGRILIPMSKIFGKVVGVDVSPEMVRLGQKHTKDMPNCEIIENNGVDLLEFSDNSFDFCFSFIVFQHIPDKKVIEKYVSEVTRILKPGSLFRFQVRGNISNKPKELTTWDGVQFSSEEIHKMANENNFQIIEEGNENEEYYWLTFKKI